jgi:ribosomal protein S3
MSGPSGSGTGRASGVGFGAASVPVNEVRPREKMAMMLAQKWALSLDARVNARIARWFI